MRKHQPKRIGAVIVWTVAFGFVVADQTDRLQKIVAFIPPRYATYLPLVYGTLGVLALLLLNSAHEDDLKNVSRPKIAFEWLNDDTTPPNTYAPVRVYNDGDSAAFRVEAVIRIDEYYAIRVGPLPSSVAPHSEMLVTPMLDNGPRQPVLSRDHARKFFRLALDWNDPMVREGRKQLAQVRFMTRTMFSETLPDESANFDVTYTDFDGKTYTTPHVLTYLDEPIRIRIRLATAADAG